MLNRKYLVSVLILITIVSSCGNNNRFKIDEKKEKQQVEIVRFDSLILNTSVADMPLRIKEFYSAHPAFMTYYAEQIMGLNPADTAKIAQFMGDFIQNKAFVSVNKDVKKIFGNIDSIRLGIEQGYSYIHHYFPEINTPPVYFFVSGFNRSIIIDNEFVGVGLDMYLGNTYPKYEEISYQYLVYNTRPASIAPDIVSALLFRHFKFDGTKERLLENMLYRGKVLYLLSVIMPAINPNEIMGYSRFQWEWSRKYEDKIWNTIVGQKDLYSTDQLLINKYLNDAPFTAPVSQESPGRLGAWTGWQIIQDYMDKNPEVTLQQLMKTNDYQLILNKSGYQP